MLDRFYAAEGSWHGLMFARLYDRASARVESCDCGERYFREESHYHITSEQIEIRLHTSFSYMESSVTLDKLFHRKLL